MGTTGNDGRFNPIMSSNVYDGYVSDLVFEGLLTNDYSGAPIPHLATWEISDDALTYTFTLVGDIHFSDGTPLTTEDVAFTFKTIAHPDYDGPRSYAVSHWLGYDDFRAGNTSEWAAIEIIDDKTIAFHMSEGTASPANIWDFGYGIMPKHIYEFNTWEDFLDMLDKPIGSGTFMFDEWRPLEYIRLSRNDNYWNPADMPNIDGILFLDIPEESLAHAFEAGEIDLAQPATNMDNYNLYSAMPIADVRSVLSNSLQFLQFNTLQPQLEDVRVRQALIYALPRQQYVDIQLGALGSVGMAPLTPASWAFPETGLNDYALNLDKARELMAEAGWEPGPDGILQKDGLRMELEWLVYPEAPWPGVVSGLAYDSWSQIGVDLTIINMDFATVGAVTFDAEPEDRDFYIFTMGFRFAIDPDPTGAIFDGSPGTMAAGGFNASGFSDPRQQELVQLGRTTFDQAKRVEIYKEWAQLVNESVATVVVAYRNDLWVVSNRINGMTIGTFWGWIRDINTITLN